MDVRLGKKIIHHLVQSLILLRLESRGISQPAGSSHSCEESVSMGILASQHCIDHCLFFFLI